MRNFIIGLVMLAIAAFFVTRYGSSNTSSNNATKAASSEPTPIKLPDAAPLASSSVPVVGSSASANAPAAASK